MDLGNPKSGKNEKGSGFKTGEVFFFCVMILQACSSHGHVFRLLSKAVADGVFT